MEVTPATNPKTYVYTEDATTLAKATGSLAMTGLGAFTFSFIAKEPGSIYADYAIKVTQRRTSTSVFLPKFNITVYDEKGFVIDNLNGIDGTNTVDMLPLLEYFDVTVDDATHMPTEESATSVFATNTAVSATVTLTLQGSPKLVSGLHADLTPAAIFEAISLYYKEGARLELEDMLSYPMSMILDGNYPVYLKEDIIDFVRDVRDDVHFLLTRAKYKETATVVDADLELDEMSEAEVTDLLDYDLPEKGLVALFAPDIERVSDPEVGGYINVSSIYELAYKIPYNDYNYGI